jgi:hypothetical protein
VAIPTDTFGGELVRKYQKLKTTFSSYNWEWNQEWKLVSESSRDTVDYFSIVICVIVNML